MMMMIGPPMMTSDDDSHAKRYDSGASHLKMISSDSQCGFSSLFQPGQVGRSECLMIQLS